MHARPGLLTVDLLGLKAPLLAQARLRGVSASQVVRDALTPALLGPGTSPAAGGAPTSGEGRVRVALRLAEGEAVELRDRAASTGVGIGSYVVELMRSAANAPSKAERSANIAALAQSNDHLAALATDLSHLVALLSKGSVRAALEYRQTLSMLDRDVRGHLKRAALALSSHGKTR